jgi:hypothetical protein
MRSLTTSKIRLLSFVSFLITLILVSSVLAQDPLPPAPLPEPGPVGVPDQIKLEDPPPCEEKDLECLSQRMDALNSELDLILERLRELKDKKDEGPMKLDTVPDLDADTPP